MRKELGERELTTDDASDLLRVDEQLVLLTVVLKPRTRSIVEMSCNTGCVLSSSRSLDHEAF